MIYDVKDYISSEEDTLQTERIQSVLDMCGENGGTVVFPSGRYKVSSLYIHSNTTVYLRAGAEIAGSDNCEDYKVFPVPEGVILYSDVTLIPQHEPDRKEKDEYRRAIFSAYNETDISIVGENGSIIDGVDCFDANGEENFRGPHAIWFSSCRNVVLRGYTVKRAADFAHQLDNCINVTAKNVKCSGGHDGFHLNMCRNVSISDCLMETGDDCIAGINVTNLVVENCYLNTSCNMFRIGGKNISVKNCEMKGIGKYPHRLSLYKGDGEFLPEEQGRRNTLFVMEFFASETVPFGQSCDVSFTNCKITDADRFIHYEAKNRLALHTGAALAEIKLENVSVEVLEGCSVVSADEKNPLTVTVKNITVNNVENVIYPLFDGNDKNTRFFNPCKGRMNRFKGNRYFQ
ncbi:MAG: hypothetical protein IJU84_09350 [Clostridia bacterium]|nr:hypothetical protein [Clostridia bacterium]